MTPLPENPSAARMVNAIEILLYEWKHEINDFRKPELLREATELARRLVPKLEAMEKA